MAEMLSLRSLLSLNTFTEVMRSWAGVTAEMCWPVALDDDEEDEDEDEKAVV